jgi:hypothetical protein
MPDINTGKKYLDQEGLSYFYGKLQTQFNGKVDKETGLGLSHNDFTDALLTKLNGIAAGAEVNQNAFSKVTVDSTDINAGSKTSTLVITSGTGITLTPDAQNGSIELSTDGVPNVIETVKVNGTALTPDEYKAVNIDISGKAEKSEMSVEAGTGADADKTTITLKSGTSATVLTSH